MSQETYVRIFRAMLFIIAKETNNNNNNNKTGNNPNDHEQENG